MHPKPLSRAATHACIKCDPYFSANDGSRRLIDDVTSAPTSSHRDMRSRLHTRQELDLKVAALGPGKRSNRYALLVEDGVIKVAFVCVSVS